MERDELKQRIIDLVNTYGNDEGRLHIFNYCSENGRELDNSTIDAIVVDGGDVQFWYNCNMKDDYVFIDYFDQTELESFIDDIEQDLIDEYGLSMQEFNENKGYIEQHMKVTSCGMTIHCPLNWSHTPMRVVTRLSTLKHCQRNAWRSGSVK